MGPLLAIPPFPGARTRVLAAERDERPIEEVEDWPSLLAALAQHRVGGSYWGPQIDDAPKVLDAANWPDHVDPWPLLDNAEEVVLSPDDPRTLLAIAAKKPLTLVNANGSTTAPDAARLTAQHLTSWRWRDPFDGAAMTPLQAIELCGFWCQLIDRNRPIGAVLGIAHWKRPTVAPLLWNGKDTPFTRGVPATAANRHVAVWRSRLSAAQEAAIADATILEIEDGFIRSDGLGADCVPPLSIIVDARGVHFDPKQPSDLEDLLQNDDFPEDLCQRAAALRKAIIAGGLSKYERAVPQPLDRPGGTRWHILVPGQVEDDRAVTSGGALSSNLELLTRARQVAGPDAFIIYKPHPDVLAGHRKGMISAAQTAQLADDIECDAPMASLIAMVDELHVNSSLAGFEALMRGKKVTVHGAPFYAGWGVTTDLGPVPDRRTRHRTLDELVAAALLLYPRYFDPETWLPCPAEVLVRRLTTERIKLNTKARAFVTVRRLAGRTNRLIGKVT